MAVAARCSRGAGNSGAPQRGANSVAELVRAASWFGILAVAAQLAAASVVAMAGGMGFGSLVGWCSCISAPYLRLVFLGPTCYLPAP